MSVNKCKTISNSQIQNYQLVVIHNRQHIIHKLNCVGLALLAKSTQMWKGGVGKYYSTNKQLLVLMSF